MNEERVQEDDRRVLKRLEYENELLDLKIKHLHYVYQNSGKMLAFTDKKDIIEQALEAFSELTGAGFISVYLRDVVSEKCEMVGYTGKNDKKKPPVIAIDFTDIGTAADLPDYLDLEDEQQADQFDQCFVNGKTLFININPRYIFILKDGGLNYGFVAIDRLNPDIVYEQAVLDAVGVLSRMMAIAYNLGVERVEAARKTENLSNRLERILQLNQIAKTINSAKSVDTIMALLMGALDVTFGVNLGFISLYNQEEMALKIETSTNMTGNIRDIPLRGELLPLLIGKKVVMYDAKKAGTLFEKKFIADLKTDMTGVCIIPICVEEYETKLIGALGILDMEEGVLTSEENVMIFEFIANHVAPIIDHIQRVDMIKKDYHQDYAATFMEALKVNMDEADIFSLDLFVVWINRLHPLTFKPWKMSSAFTMPNVYKIDRQNLLILTSDKDDIDMLGSQIRVDEQMRVFKFRTDFDSLQGFEHIFE